MSMNKYMHPRNPYKRQRIDFAELAQKFDFFRDACERDNRGRVTVNFKIPQQLSALTRAILLRDFQLDLQLPMDRLIPTVPLRMNYLLWLEDIFGQVEGLRGIDIGTGSSCIYPLLGVKRRNWKFVATEADERNLNYATINITNNQMQKAIQLLRAPSDAPPLAFPLQKFPQYNFNFCMCNPPFFADALQAQGLVNSRSSSRHPPMSASSAAGIESFSSGGELLFVTRIAQDSAEHRDRCRVFTSMLGRKPSLGPLKRLLRSLGVASLGTYEFCQGRVMRWGIGWSFDPSVVFPMSEFKKKKLQNKPPLTLELPPPSDNLLSQGINYSSDSILQWIKLLLKQKLQIDYWDQLLKSGQTGRRLRISAKCITWTKLRQQRRHPVASSATSSASGTAAGVTNAGMNDSSTASSDDLQKSQLGGTPLQSFVSESRNTENPTGDGSSATISGSVNAEQASKRCADDDSSAEVADSGLQPPPTKRKRTASEIESENEHVESEKAVTANGDSETTPSTDSTGAAVLVANLCLDVNSSGNIELRLQWLDGGGRELLHQLMLFIRNQYTCAFGLE